MFHRTFLMGTKWRHNLFTLGAELSVKCPALGVKLSYYNIQKLISTYFHKLPFSLILEYCYTIGLFMCVCVVCVCLHVCLCVMWCNPDQHGARGWGERCRGLGNETRQRGETDWRCVVVMERGTRDAWLSGVHVFVFVPARAVCVPLVRASVCLNISVLCSENYCTVCATCH